MAELQGQSIRLVMTLWEGTYRKLGPQGRNSDHTHEWLSPFRKGHGFFWFLRRAEEIARKRILFHRKGNGRFLSENPGTAGMTANSPSLGAFKRDSEFCADRGPLVSSNVRPTCLLPPTPTAAAESFKGKS